jgi:hypothetical protein
MHDEFLEKKDSIANAIVELLFTDLPIHEALKKKSFVRSLFWQKDEKILQEIANEFQKLVINVFQKLTQNISTDDEKKLEYLLANILAIYPFLQLKDDSFIVHPQKIEGKWILIQYHIVCFEITPKCLGSPIVAYGLVPQDVASSPLFLFPGTGYPTMPGFLLSVWTDFVPAMTVGGLVFSISKEKIRNSLRYLRMLSWERKVKLYGLSLGGSLALHTICVFSEHIDEVYAFSPPALCKREVALFDASKSNAKVNIFIRENDPAPYVGMRVSTLWNYYQIRAEKKWNPFLAHIRVLPIFSQYDMHRFERKEWKVFIFTILHAVISIPIFLITTLCVVIKSLAGFLTRR